MRFSETEALDDVYRLVERLYAEADEPEHAMTICAALIALGERTSWASVWWAYGAVHHDLSDEAYRRALEVLAAVDHPRQAVAAALMLTAEIEQTSALERDASPDRDRQRELVQRAAGLEPGWPELRIRAARACADVGDLDAARVHAAEALALLGAAAGAPDRIGAALTGASLDPTYVEDELRPLISSDRGSLPQEG